MWRILIIYIFLLIHTPTSVFAQDDSKQSAIQNMASSGSLAATVLETAGYQAQTLVLNSEKGLGRLIQSFAVLLFVIACVSSIVLFVVVGDFERAFYFFIFPALFYFAIGTTKLGQPVEWRLGEFNGNQQAVTATLNDTLGKTRVTEFEVSWLFNKFNTLISTIYRGLISVITGDKSSAVSKQFMVRENLMRDLTSLTINKGGLIGLTTETLSLCSEEIEAARTLALGYRDPIFTQTPEWFRAEAKSKTWAASPNKPLLSQQAISYLQNQILPTVAASNNGSTNLKTFGVDKDGKPISVSLIPGEQIFAKCYERLREIKEKYCKPTCENIPAFNCEQLWCATMYGLHQEVNTFLSNKQTSLETSLGMTKEEFADMVKAVAHKLGDPKKFYNNDGTALDGVTPAAIDPSALPLIIGGFILKKIIIQGGPAISGVLKDAGFRSNTYSFRDIRTDGEALAEKQIGYYISEEKRYELLNFLQGIPYLQGIFLYSLSLLFPFFALMLLVPGKAQGFGLFFSLWAWVKSWDVGWAFVMTLDNFLWQLVPHSASANILRDPNFGPASILDIAFHSDPAYGLHLYYLIISTLMTAVPIFTAQLMLGAHARLVTPLLHGFQNYARSTVSMGIRPALQADESGRADRIRDLEVGNAVQKEGQKVSADFDTLKHSKNIQQDYNSIKNDRSLNPAQFTLGQKNQPQTLDGLKLGATFYQIGSQFNSYLENSGGDLAKLEQSDPNIRKATIAKLTAIGFNPTAANQLFNEKKAGIVLQQYGNQIGGEMIKAHMNMFYFERTSQSSDYQAWDGLRAANNARYEPHTMYDSPHQIQVKMMALFMQADQTLKGMQDYLDTNQKQSFFGEASKK